MAESVLSENLPGQISHPPELMSKLAAAMSGRAAGSFRTRHLHADGRPKYVNRLLLEPSPYLQQHAHNPVNWHSWGDEAFELARETGKPILLSVGYSTCHWCHVMEEESFEDEGVAEAMNSLYIPVKVDREERPDVDAIYMTAVQAMTGHGGWPMTVWLKADGRPYYGGTYFPARDGDRGARSGFLTLLTELARLYKADPPRIEQAAVELTGAIRERLGTLNQGQLPDEGTLSRAFKYYQRSADRSFGGMTGAPKFPSSMPVRFLLRYHQRTGEPEALAMAEKALEQMAKGGIYDQVGGGFHRYSTDELWLVPHFEKMLYDNALLVSAYVEAWQLTGKRLYQDVARETLDYVIREMTADHGGFFSATDADSKNPLKNGEREEGWFFTWTLAELKDVLGPEVGAKVAAIYGVEAEGNFEGRSVLSRQVETSELTQTLKMTAEQIEELIRQAKPKLFQARAYRPAPLLDDKILAAWNGLMISAFAKAGEAFGEQCYLDHATKAARFVMLEMTQNGRLKRSHAGGTARHDGYLEDYAFVIQGLLDLYEATFAREFLTHAMKLADTAQDLFEDPAKGGYFATAKDASGLIVREKAAHDGATPSGNSVMAVNLFRFAALTGLKNVRDTAEGTLKAFGDVLARMPAALSEMLIAVDYLVGPTRQILFVAPKHLDELQPFRMALGRKLVPRRAVAASLEQELAEVSATIRIFDQKKTAGGKATAYVCVDTVCKLPTADVKEFERQL